MGNKTHFIEKPVDVISRGRKMLCLCFLSDPAHSLSHAVSYYHIFIIMRRENIPYFDVEISFDLPFSGFFLYPILYDRVRASARGLWVFSS